MYFDEPAWWLEVIIPLTPSHEVFTRTDGAMLIICMLHFFECESFVFAGLASCLECEFTGLASGYLVFDRIRRKSTYMPPGSVKPVMLPGTSLTSLGTESYLHCTVVCIPSLSPSLIPSLSFSHPLSPSLIPSLSFSHPLSPSLIPSLSFSHPLSPSLIPSLLLSSPLSLFPILPLSLSPRGLHF